MADNTLRIFVRAAGLDFEEVRRDPGVPREGPGAPDADARGERRAEGLALGELRDHAPSIADIRLAASLEFLHAIDYDFPAWAREYMTAMEEALGEAYSEPAADVRGFVASVK